MTFQVWAMVCCQLASRRLAWAEWVRAMCCSIRSRISASSGSSSDGALEDDVLVGAAPELLLLVDDEGEAVGHAGAEVAAGRTEHDDGAAGHVLAAVIADAFDDRRGAAVADREALAGLAGHEERAAGRAVEDRVAGDHLRRRERGRPRRQDRDLAAGHALADVVVRLALEDQPHAADRERAEALAGAAGEPGGDRARFERVKAVS